MSKVKKQLLASPQELAIVRAFEIAPESRPDTHHPNPIKKSVPGLGEVVRHEREALSDREDNWFGIELDGFMHGVRITEPLNSEGPLINIVHLPGFTEVIESGPGKALHNRFAELLPWARIISIASDGVGNTGDKLTPGNMWDHGVDAMAEERLKLLEALCSDQPIVLQGLSMGTVISYGIIDGDLRNGHNLNTYPLNFDTALVTPERVFPDMMGFFVPLMTLDAPREFLSMWKRYGLPGALDRVYMLPEHLKGNFLPLVVEAKGLKGGTPFTRIERVTRAVGATTVSGQYDSLAQFRMWSSIKRDISGLHISMVRGRGHGIAADGAEAADKMIRILNQYDIPNQLLAA